MEKWPYVHMVHVSAGLMKINCHKISRQAPLILWRIRFSAAYTVEQSLNLTEGEPIKKLYFRY